MAKTNDAEGSAAKLALPTMQAADRPDAAQDQPWRNGLLELRVETQGRY
jgi:hypothetical protein